MANDGWRSRAACIGADTKIFFDEDKKTMLHSLAKAKDYCNACPVQQECLDFAISENIMVGIYGGFSRKQRLIINRKRKVMNYGTY